MPKRGNETRVDRHGFVALRKRDIERQADRDVFGLGEALFRHGAILDPVLQGSEIRALCAEAGLYPVAVEATLARPGDRGPNPRAFTCSCLEERWCQHVVALLLAWIETPDRFMPIQAMTDRLSDKSREQLIEIVERMLAVAPDLVRLVDDDSPVVRVVTTPVGVTAASVAQQARLDLEPFRVFRPLPGAHLPGSNALQEIVGLAHDRAGHGRWADTITIFHALTEELIPVARHYRGDDSQLLILVISAERGLTEALAAQEGVSGRDRLSSKSREMAIRTLYDIWRFFTLEPAGRGIESNGLPISASVLTHAERAMVDDWATSEQLDDVVLSDRVLRLRASLLEVVPGGELELLEFYRQHGWWDAYASVLLQLDRQDEALAVAEEHLLKAPYTTALFDRMLHVSRHGAEDLMPLLQGFPWQGDPESPIREAVLEYWLMSQYLELDRPDRALEYAVSYFNRHPVLSRWEELRSIAGHPAIPPGTWQSMRAGLTETMLSAGRWPDVIDSQLEDGDVRAALDTYAAIDRSTVRKPRTWGFDPTPDLIDLQEIGDDLASLAAADFPDEAVAIYTTQAEDSIAQRKRTGYQQAAALLAAARDVLSDHGRQAEARSVIDDVRQRYPSLRALQQELDAIER